jgi:hypothetical protein
MASLAAGATTVAAGDLVVAVAGHGARTVLAGIVCIGSPVLVGVSAGQVPRGSLATTGVIGASTCRPSWPARVSPPTGDETAPSISRCRPRSRASRTDGFACWREEISAAPARRQDSRRIAPEADLEMLATMALAAVRDGLLLAKTTRDSPQPVLRSHRFGLAA